MQFDNKYFEDEIREGFYVPGIIKRSWACQMDVLEVIDQICVKHHIKWFADYGTLIGAVRHRGFIPWDDDLDICMLRDDYEKFRTIMDDELPSEYHILDFDHEESYGNFLLRIVNGSQINYSDTYLKEHHEFPYLAGIDIFPVDYVYPDEEKENDRKKRACELISMAEKTADMKDRSELLKKLDRTFSEYDGKDSIYVAYMPFWCPKDHHKYPYYYFKHTIKLPFENGSMINAPAGYLEMMRLNYGDWWKINRSGGIHDYPYFLVQETSLKKAFNDKLPYRYSCIKSDLDDILVEKERPYHKSDFVKRNEEVLDIINSAQQMLKACIDRNDHHSALELLARIQELMLQVGNDIESLKGEGFITVRAIEEYFNALYLAYETINQAAALDTNDNSSTINGTIDSIINKYECVRRSFDNDVCGYNDILFMPARADYWDNMSKFYDSLKADEENIYIVPISLYKKTFKGQLYDQEYDLEKYPDNIMLTKMDDYDFDNRHPKMIVIQLPYDQYNSAVSTHPFFYAKDLRAYTDKLIYIPWFNMDDVDVNDGKSMANTAYYIKTPGVLYSDEIYLSSEEQKKLYVDILSETYGEDTRTLWENKIKSQEVYITRNGIANAVNITQNKTKTILLFLSLSEYYIHNDNMLLKLQRVLDIFKENKDKVNIIWTIETGFMEGLEEICPSEYDKFVGLKEEFINEGLGVIENTDNIKNLIDNIDAYYGDGGYIMNMFVRAKKPVMLINVDI